MTQAGNSEHLIRTLYQITSSYQQGFENQVQMLLELGCERFDLEIGILARVEQNEYIVQHFLAPQNSTLSEGMTFPLSDSFCSVTLEAGFPVSIEQVKNSAYASHPAYRAFGLEAYVGVPIMIEDRVYGTLSFSSAERRERHFSELEIDSLQLMATWLEGEIHRREMESELKRANSRLRKYKERLEETNLQLKELALTDPLTSLANRRALMDEFERQLNYCHRTGLPISVVVIDADNFKILNDEHGHTTGDEALVLIADTLRQHARGGDYISRFGGEEFVALLPDTDANAAALFAERIRKAIMHAEGLPCRLTASFGVSNMSPSSTVSPDFRRLTELLLWQADHAMYRAKADGKNTIRLFQA